MGDFIFKIKLSDVDSKESRGSSQAKLSRRS